MREAEEDQRRSAEEVLLGYGLAGMVDERECAADLRKSFDLDSAGKVSPPGPSTFHQPSASVNASSPATPTAPQAAYLTVLRRAMVAPSQCA